MRIKKNLSILTALACSLVLSSAAVAEEYRCEVTSYSGALASLQEGVTNKITIVQSWIPTNFTINICGLTFDGWNQMSFKKPPKNSVYRANITFDYNGKPLPTKYRVHIQKENKGYIWMDMRGFKKMGPIPISCKLVQESPSTCPEQEDQ